MKSPRAWIVALALSAGALGSLALAPASLAAAPNAGVNCQSSDGKISGRGSTLQLWLQYKLMGQYTSDVCGPVAAQAAANGGDITHPGSAVWTLPGGTTYSQDWMVAYNYPSAQDLGSGGSNAAIGSGAGQTTISCRAESFSGTDIPATTSQRTTINGAVPAAGGTSLGKNCDPYNGTKYLTSPFQPAINPGVLPATPNPTPGTYPNPGDTTAPKGVMVVPIGISAVDIFANLPTTCVSTTPVTLSTSDMQGLWGGSITNWSQITDAGTGNLGSACNLAVTRVVRQDNSGTTQGFDNYMADAFGYTTATCTGNLNTNAGTFGAMQGNQANNGTNVNWPGNSANGIGGGATSTCSAVITNSAAGGPNLISTAEATNGSIGYADYADTQHDTNNFASQIAGNSIYQFNLTSSAGTSAAPNSGSGSNCSSTATAPSTTTAAVGLNGYWDLAAQTATTIGPDDITWTNEGSSYPICSLTWDFVWTNMNGNSPPKPTTTFSAGQTSIVMSSVAGLPTKGTFTIPASDGTDTVSYTGITLSTNTLTGVTGDTGNVTTATAVTFPTGTAGGPEPNLTPDQRRNLYSYYTYLMSDAAQLSESSAGYVQLPESFLNLVRSGFQSNF